MPIHEKKQKRYKTPSPKDGRPKIQIDWEIFDELCKIQCTQVEIASIFKCSVDTIERHVLETKGQTFAEYYKIQSSDGKASLRRSQYKAALDGNATMLIWLGKQVLKQTDQVENIITMRPMIIERNREIDGADEVYLGCEEIKHIEDKNENNR